MSKSPLAQLQKNPHYFHNEFLTIKFQTGVPPDVGINGVRGEDVIDVLLAKLELYQTGSLACHENEETMAYLLKAKDALQRRRQRRMLQGVFNTMTPHEERTEDMHDEFSATGA